MRVFSSTKSNFTNCRLKAKRSIDTIYVLCKKEHSLNHLIYMLEKKQTFLITKIEQKVEIVWLFVNANSIVKIFNFSNYLNFEISVHRKDSKFG